MTFNNSYATGRVKKIKQTGEFSPISCSILNITSSSEIMLIDFVD